MSCGTGDCSTCEVSENRGCGVSSVFDWLYQIDSPLPNKYIEVQFKGDRKDFYLNDQNTKLSKGDFVTVEAEKSGYDVGKVTMTGELVELQMKRKNRDIETFPPKQVYRISTKNDLQKWEEAVKNESNVLEKAKRIIEEFNLDMKLSDVEFQGDNTKATFYYIADKRVDFRQLIREYSSQFRVKIEMRQIGARQEAAKIGGIGSCGRELCCSKWMTEFPSVSTSAARYQQLSINPQKISGQCGRLKCCLNFELDGYTEALKEFPNTKEKLKSKTSTASFVKLDVFRSKMYYYNLNEPGSDLLEFEAKKAKELIELNKKGEIPEDFSKFVIGSSDSENYNFTNEESITRFDSSKTLKKKKRSERRERFKKNKLKARKRKHKNENS